jgi:hypothetical protein
MSLFNSATPPQIQALARLGTPDMAPLGDLLGQTVSRLQDQMVRAETMIAVYRLQGEITALNDLLLSIKKAPEALSRFG